MWTRCVRFRVMVRWNLLFQTMESIKSSFALSWLFFKKYDFQRPEKRGWPFRRLLKIFLESAVFPDLSDSARKILKDDRVHTVIFGHTHVYQYTVSLIRLRNILTRALGPRSPAWTPPAWVVLQNSPMSLIDYPQRYLMKKRSPLF